MSILRTEYYRSELLTMRHVACRSVQKGKGEMASSDGDRLILPLRGICMMHFSRTNNVIAEQSLALIVPAGRSCNVSHPVTPGDDCLVAEFSVDCFHEVLETLVSSADISSAGTHSPLSLRAMTVRNLIWYRLARNFAGGLEAEETALALLSYTLKHSQQKKCSQRRCSKIPRQIDIAKVVLLTHPEKNWSLTALARILDCSPFYLTRTFREYIGMPLHRYQLHTRLARSLDLLLDTNQDLMTIALNLGFNSHSHFTSSFRQSIGFTPNRLREIASSRIAAEIRQMLI